MGGVKPGGILTDQCASIEAGIRHALAPETVHRFCSWHILHKLCTKWGNVPDKTDLTDRVKEIVYQSHTPMEFEDRWTSLMEEIGYSNDTWFKNIFSIREKWVPAYLSGQFWAGMTTTQRVESMNNFLNKYLKKRENLGEFVENFEEALRRIWSREPFPALTVSSFTECSFLTNESGSFPCGKSLLSAFSIQRKDI